MQKTQKYFYPNKKKRFFIRYRKRSECFNITYMNPSNRLLRIEARTKRIWEELQATDPEIIADLLMSPSDVQETLTGIDSESIIVQLTKELQQAIYIVNKEPLHYEAICYEWYHDSYDLQNPAIGKAHEKCAYNFLSHMDAGPDNNWTVVNEKKPALGGHALDLNRLSVYLVTEAWYELIGKSEQKKEFLYNDLYDNMPMALFDELFKLKLFTLLETAYANVTGNKPGYFSVALYGYWHTVLTDYRIESAGTNTANVDRNESI
ncbi:hypothetical protein CHU_2362 [Cytophaga hutchinsonii ATCC 33406]|uniref:Uncharacterized protein n=2 Tax=Cytophaga hutchinsonii TaxID=985 RepID=A0A6N4ST74_CYTH3|nr:hypothetical protein CHU_2362 [Cytophaga hutchinsonii ATCC 33406]